MLALVFVPLQLLMLLLSLLKILPLQIQLHYYIDKIAIKIMDEYAKTIMYNDITGV